MRRQPRRLGDDPPARFHDSDAGRGNGPRRRRSEVARAQVGIALGEFDIGDIKAQMLGRHLAERDLVTLTVRVGADEQGHLAVRVHAYLRRFPAARLGAEGGEFAAGGLCQSPPRSRPSRCPSACLRPSRGPVRPAVRHSAQARAAFHAAWPNYPSRMCCRMGWCKGTGRVGCNCAVACRRSPGQAHAHRFRAIARSHGSAPGRRLGRRQPASWFVNTPVTVTCAAGVRYGPVIRMR